MKLIIIGGGAGGASVAARVRRLNEAAEIILVDKAEEISQATCGIPYHIGAIIKDRERMVVVEPETFSDILNVNVRTCSEVISIDKQRKEITIKDTLTKKIYIETYDKLVLSPGSRPIYPDIPGIKQNNIFCLYNLDDMDNVTRFLSQNVCQDAVIIGGGFIGLEIAENLQAIGMATSIVEASKQVMPPLDPEMVAIIHRHLINKNVNLLLNEKVESINKNIVCLSSKKEIHADIIIVAIGAVPQIDLAIKSGLKIGPLGGVWVNEGLLTSDNNIYALGDAVEIDEHLHNSKTIVQLAGPTHKQASIVAENIVARHKNYNSVQSTSIVKIFDYTVAITGYSEKKLKQHKINYQKSYTDTSAHASYYPKSFPLNMKLLFAPNTGTLLGAQVIGITGVDKRIDVLSTVIQFEKTIFDLAEMELSYAPPFSSAKDPINIAGMVARNIIKEDFEVIFWDEIDSCLMHGALLVDVRTKDEYDLFHIDGALNIPLESIRNNLDLLPKNKQIVLCCEQGKKSYFAYQIMRQNGYKKILSLSGGLKIYRLGKNKSGVIEDIKVKKIKNDEFMSLINSNVNMTTIDAVGLSCPGPILKLSKNIKKIRVGDQLTVYASDISFEGDIVTWCNKTGNILHLCTSKDGLTTAIIQKN